MNACDSTWDCSSCLQKGNVIKLQKLWERNKEELTMIEIYNPRKEIKEIRHLLKKLDQNDLSKNLTYKIEKLLNYFNNNENNGNKKS
jgi:hypothetical protein